jgi:hypothetical protein
MRIQTNMHAWHYFVSHIYQSPPIEIIVLFARVDENRLTVVSNRLWMIAPQAQAAAHTKSCWQVHHRNGSKTEEKQTEEKKRRHDIGCC